MTDPLAVLRDYAKLAPWNIRDLASLSAGILDASGITPINAAAQSRPSDRTVRFYVTRHLMSAPDGRGTAATYGYRHLLQLLAIKLRQMEGATLTSIARELTESTGDVLEKKIAASLGSIPAPDQLSFGDSAVPRGRVARALARRDSHVAGSDGAAPPLEAGAWYRFSLGDGVELSMRHDHPAARSALQRQRVVSAATRALREAADIAEA